MPKMLRHLETGEVFPMNPNLAMHEKMVPFDPVDEQFYIEAHRLQQEVEADARLNATQRLEKARKLVEELERAAEVEAEKEIAAAEQPAEPVEAEPKPKGRAKKKTTTADDIGDLDIDI